MQIILKIDGKDRIFTQNTINFKTMMMALEHQQKMERQIVALTQTLGSGIDESVENEIDHSELFKPGEDLVACAHLIVAFFDGQFTFDEFYNGAYFETVADLYATATAIFEMAFEHKKESENRQPKKSLLKTSIS